MVMERERGKGAGSSEVEWLEAESWEVGWSEAGSSQPGSSEGAMAMASRK
jgi:hypothetical protein